MHKKICQLSYKFANQSSQMLLLFNSNKLLSLLDHPSNQKVKSNIVTEVTVRSPFITYFSQTPWNFLDMEVIMIKEDDKC